MAELFLARDTRSERLVVLKRILPYLAEEAEFVRMFLDEARIAAALHHPSIAELYELGHLDGSTYISMEWVDGIDLRRVLQKEQARGGVVPPGIAAWIVARLCEGLGHAHAARDAEGTPLGIIHRDVSPQNVMLSFKGEVKLVDFGIAKATAWMSRSKPGVIKGKFLYLAPEQLGSEALDHRADLFALGTLLYELATGASPFSRASTEAVIYAIRMEEPDPPEQVRPGFPPGLSRVILRCLVKDRARRYQTAEEIAGALEDFMRAEAPTTRTDVMRYVSRLFGDENERTGLYIPPNAQVSRSEEGAAPAAADDAERDQEPTVSLKEPPPRAPAAAGGEGTGEVPEVTEPTRADRPRPRPRPGTEPETTAPMAPRLARDDARTVEVGAHAPALGDEPPAPTATSSPELREPPQLPRRSPAPRPAPPLPSSESIPEVSAVSVVSAGEATIGTLAAGEPAESRPTKPSPPRPRARPVARRGPPTSTLRRAPEDPDDRVETVDQAQEFSMTRAVRPRRAPLLLLGAAGALVAVLLAVWLWPAAPSSPTTPVAPPPVVEPAPPEQGTAPTESSPVEPAPEPAPITVVKVKLRAVRGTQLTVDGAAVAPDAVLERAPGELVVRFSCPPRRKARRETATLRATIPASTGVVAVDVPCR